MTQNTTGFQTLSEIFPLSYNQVRPQLIELFTTATSQEIGDIIEGMKQKISSQDTRRQELYLSGAYGRLGIVEWGPDYNELPELEREIALIQKFLSN